MIQPGQPGSQTPAGPDWMVRKMRELEQRIEQLSGQLSRVKAQASSGVVNVAVTGSVLTVTFGDGTTHSYQLA